MSSSLATDPSRARLPRNYLTVLQTIRGAEPGLHLSAHDVYAKARADQPKIGFATVHRALGRLCELGYVCKVDIPGAPAAIYECSAESHAHFRCAQCGRVVDIDFAVSQAALAAISQRHGLEICAESTTFVGRCSMCANIASAPTLAHHGDDGRLGRSPHATGRRS